MRQRFSTRFPWLLVLVPGISGLQVAATAATVDVRVALNACQGLVEEHLAGVMRSARLVARTREAKTARWQMAKPLLDAFSADLGTDATVF